MAFIGTVITIILSLYLFGFISRLLLRFWISKKIRDMQNGKGGASFGGSWTNMPPNGRYNNPQSKQEGEVTITTVVEPDRKIDSSVGEYVEYDEIKEEK